VEAPTCAELTAVVNRIASRVGRFLQRQGLLERDVDNPCLCELVLDGEPMEALLAHAITWRIAVEPRGGRKVFTLAAPAPGDEGSGAAAGKVDGVSLHAGVAARADERDKLERLCRYISRPAVSEERLSLTPGGVVRYQLKTPYSNGTTHVLFEPLDFIARLAARVPKSTSRLSAVCGGAMRIIAWVEDPVVIEKILTHRTAKAAGHASEPPPSRAPPARAWG
jgi:hypothetical protein